MSALTRTELEDDLPPALSRDYSAVAGSVPLARSALVAIAKSAGADDDQLEAVRRFGDGHQRAARKRHRAGHGRVIPAQSWGKVFFQFGSCEDTHGWLDSGIPRLSIQ